MCHEMPRLINLLFSLSYITSPMVTDRVIEKADQRGNCKNMSYVKMCHGDKVCTSM